MTLYLRKVLLTCCLLVPSADNLCKQFRTKSKLFDTDGITKSVFLKVDFKKKSTDDKKACKITQQAKS